MDVTLEEGYLNIIHLTQNGPPLAVRNNEFSAYEWTLLILLRRLEGQKEQPREAREDKREELQ